MPLQEKTGAPIYGMLRHKKTIFVFPCQLLSFQK